MHPTTSSHHGTRAQHKFMVGDSEFTVDTRYQFVKAVGTGAYGTVISCRDLERNGEEVAIKKVPKAFDDVTDSKRVLREVKLLRHMRHENIVSILDIIHPNCSMDEYTDVYMVMDLMETDLHRIIYSRQPLGDEHAQFFLFQLLRALKYLHSAGVVHRDIKPSNLLINASCDLKLCDFGLARGLDQDEVNLTEYVVTRWYRAPEIMLSCNSYNFSIDVWSAGCIFAEILQRKPLFPGEDYIHQLQIINEFLGSPNEAELEFVSLEKAKHFIRNLPRSEGIRMDKHFPGANPVALDLLQRMIKFNPADRISVDDALNHAYFKTYSEEMVNPECDEAFEFRHEPLALNSQMLRELMWEEMSAYHPEARQEFEERRLRGQLESDKALRAYYEQQAKMEL